MRRASGWTQPFFEVDSYRVHVEERVGDGEPPLAEATVKVLTKGTRHIESAEGHGPVGALDDALRKALTNDYPELEHIELEDYRVRVLAETHGTGAVVRVLIDSSNGERSWTTVGVSENIIEASWEALTDAYLYGLLHPREVARRNPPTGRLRLAWEDGDSMEMRSIGSIPCRCPGSAATTSDVGSTRSDARGDRRRLRGRRHPVRHRRSLRRHGIEEFLGRALKGRRDEAVVVSKFGMRTPPDGMTGGDPDGCVARARRASAPRHRPDRRLPAPRARRPDADRGHALDDVELDRRGQGPPDRVLELLREAAGGGRGRGDGAEVRPFVTVQNEYSLLAREARDEVLPACERLGSASCRTSRSPRACSPAEVPEGGAVAAGSAWRDPAGGTSSSPTSGSSSANASPRSPGDRYSLLELALSWLASQRPVDRDRGRDLRPAGRDNAAAVEAWKMSDEELAELDELLG